MSSQSKIFLSNVEVEVGGIGGEKGVMTRLEAACSSYCIRYFILFRNALGGVKFDYNVWFVDHHPRPAVRNFLITRSHSFYLSILRTIMVKITENKVTLHVAIDWVYTADGIPV